MASSSNSHEVTSPWLELPREITAMILQKLGPVEILRTAEKVCRTWRSVCRDPAMWQHIDMRDPDRWTWTDDLDRLCREAVDHSRGQLIDISIDYYASDDLLLYISKRSSQLRRLRLEFCHHITDELVSEAIKDFSLLEELHLYYTLEHPPALATIKSVGRHCPHLKSFKLNRRWSRYNVPEALLDEEALAIAENMPGVRHLQLLGNPMTGKGVQAIRDGCPNLESLDLRQCVNVDLGGELGQLCRERIKHFRHPNDNMTDYEFCSQHYLCDDDNDHHVDPDSDFSNYDYDDHIDPGSDFYDDYYDDRVDPDGDFNDDFYDDFYLTMMLS